MKHNFSETMADYRARFEPREPTEDERRESTEEMEEFDARMTCPMCRSVAGESLGTFGSYEHFKCRACGWLFSA